MAVGKTNEGSELPAKPYKEVDERERERVRIEKDRVGMEETFGIATGLTDLE